MNGDDRLEPIDSAPLVDFWAVRVWLFALFHPSVSTFETLLKDPRAGTRRALWWFVGFSLLNASILMMESFLFRKVTSWDLIAGSLFISMFFSILIIFSIAIIEFVAERIGGGGDFSKLLYAFATFGAPLTPIVMILDLVPFSAIIWLLPVVYGLVLGHFACKAVHQFEWISVFISLAPVTIGFIVLFGFSAIL